MPGPSSQSMRVYLMPDLLSTQSLELVELFRVGNYIS